MLVNEDRYKFKVMDVNWEFLFQTTVDLEERIQDLNEIRNSDELLFVECDIDHLREDEWKRELSNVY